MTCFQVSGAPVSYYLFFAPIFTVNFYSYSNTTTARFSHFQNKQKLACIHIGATVKNLHDQKSRAHEQLFTLITFAKKNFLLIHAKNKYKAWDCARDT